MTVQGIASSYPNELLEEGGEALANILLIVRFGDEPAPSLNSLSFSMGWYINADGIDVFFKVNGYVQTGADIVYSTTSLSDTILEGSIDGVDKGTSGAPLYDVAPGISPGSIFYEPNPDDVFTRGVLAFASGAFFSTATYTGSIYFGIESIVVPIPATVWLFGSGLIGLIGLARRK